jgi:hypothetical protein
MGSKELKVLKGWVDYQAALKQLSKLMEKEVINESEEEIKEIIESIEEYETRK